MTNGELRAIFDDFKEHMNTRFDDLKSDVKDVKDIQKTQGDKIIELEKKNLTHFIDCPVVQRVKTLEDTQISSKAIKHWKSGLIAAGAAISAILTIILKLFHVI